MPQQTIREMVLRFLPFLDGTLIPVQTTVDQYINDAFYVLYKPLGIAIADVEDESQYVGIARLLVAYYVAYEMLRTKIVENLTGNATTGVKPGAAARRIKRGKADVVEGEFDYAKASDGTILTVQTDSLMSDLKKKICELAGQLGIYLTLCDCGKDLDVIPPFVITNTCD